MPPFLLQTTSDIVKVLILQLARRSWNTLARLLQLAVLTLEYKPLLAHELANAGAIGVVLGASSHHAALACIALLDTVSRKRGDLSRRSGEDFVGCRGVQSLNAMAVPKTRVSHLHTCSHLFTCPHTTPVPSRAPMHTPPDILHQAPRHHGSWEALSTAGAGLLAALVRCDAGGEAAQPQVGVGEQRRWQQLWSACYAQTGCNQWGAATGATGPQGCWHGR